MANKYEYNSEFRITNKTSNNRLMCFVIDSIIALLIINNI